MNDFLEMGSGLNIEFRDMQIVRSKRRSALSKKKKNTEDIQGNKRRTYSMMLLKPLKPRPDSFKRMTGSWCQKQENNERERGWRWGREIGQVGNVWAFSPDWLASLRLYYLAKLSQRKKIQSRYYFYGGSKAFFKLKKKKKKGFLITFQVTLATVLPKYLAQTATIKHFLFPLVDSIFWLEVLDYI